MDTNFATGFLAIMRRYEAEGTVFQSPEARAILSLKLMSLAVMKDSTGLKTLIMMKPFEPQCAGFGGGVVTLNKTC